MLQAWPFDPTRRHFDVIVAGEPHVRLGSSALELARGAPGVAVALASARFRVGLVASVDDDTIGRALLDHVAARGVDVGGSALTPPAAGVVFVGPDATSNEIISYRDVERPFVIPSTWSAAVLVLVGASPVVSVAGSLCRAARAARRRGSRVVLSLEVRPHAWQGRDARAVRMLCREVDAIHATARDLDVLGMTFDELRAAARSDAVLVLAGFDGAMSATGPFGEVLVSALRSRDRTDATDDEIVASIAAELVGTRHDIATHGEPWRRVLARTAFREPTMMRR